MRRIPFTLLAMAFGSVVASYAHGQPVTEVPVPQSTVRDDHPVSHDPPASPTRQTAVDVSTTTTLVGSAGFDPLEQYRARELYTKYSFWKQMEVFRAGKPVELGYFGGTYRDVFGGSPSALDSMSKYRTMRISGTALWVTGLTLMVADIVLLASGSSSVVGRNARGEVNSVKPLYLALLVPGAVMGLSGAVMMQGANGYLSDAIEQYNSDLSMQVRRRSADASIGRAPGLCLRGSF